jgi:hypothetical protein
LPSHLSIFTLYLYTPRIRFASVLQLH